MQINSHLLWQVKVYKFKVGNNEVDFGGNASVIFNSGIEPIMIPKMSYNVIMVYLIGDKSCSHTPIGLWKCPCEGIDDPTYPPISIQMGSEFNNHIFTLENV